MVKLMKLLYQGNERCQRLMTLAQNYPNPLWNITINYQIPKDGLVTLKIYDVLGKEAATLVNEFKNTGRYSKLFPPKADPPPAEM